MKDEYEPWIPDDDQKNEVDRFLENELQFGFSEIYSQVTSRHWGVAMEPLDYNDYIECGFIPSRILSLANNLKFPLSLVCCGKDTHPFDVQRGIRMLWKQHNENWPSW